MMSPMSSTKNEKISLAADDLEHFEVVRPSSGTPCSELKAATDAWLLVPDSIWCSAGQPGHWGGAA